MASASSLATASNPLSELISAALSRKNPATSYCGEITPLEAFQYLAKEGGMLVDVRTVPEWQFVGMPDLDGCKGQLLAISWKVYPEMAENAKFLDHLESAGVALDTPLFFMCRGGGRSSSAANAASQAGYRYCFNVATGFEGAADPQGHRGRMSGWQGSDLPWKH